MNGKTHKLLGFLLFIILYFFNYFPNNINDYLNENLINLFIAVLIVFLFSGGRIKSRNWWSFGLSPDNDYHKKMKRDWLLHSAILPTIFVIILPHPLIILTGFFYTLHVALDLLNPHSWDGNKYTYIAVFLTVIFYYILIYS